MERRTEERRLEPTALSLMFSIAEEKFMGEEVQP
jgi:hypothetical protein